MAFFVFFFCTFLGSVSFFFSLTSRSATLNALVLFASLIGLMSLSVLILVLDFDFDLDLEWDFYFKASLFWVYNFLVTFFNISLSLSTWYDLCVCTLETDRDLDLSLDFLCELECDRSKTTGDVVKSLFLLSLNFLVVFFHVSLSLYLGIYMGWVLLWRCVLVVYEFSSFLYRFYGVTFGRFGDRFFVFFDFLAVSIVLRGFSSRFFDFFASNMDIISLK